MRMMTTGESPLKLRLRYNTCTAGFCSCKGMKTIYLFIYEVVRSSMDYPGGDIIWWGRYDTNAWSSIAVSIRLSVAIL